MEAETKPEIPLINSCRPCKKLERVHTQIGEGYACMVCKATWIETSKGVCIPFSQAMELAKKQRVRAERKARENARRQHQSAAARKKRKKKRR